MNTAWWERPFRTFQTNLREIDADLDVERVLDQIQGYGADTWLLSVGGIVANYPSALPSQTANPLLSQRPSGDLVGDAITAARQRDVRVLARMDFSKVDTARAEQHPEWCFVDAAGERQTYNGLVSVCPSGSYYQVEMFRIVAEVLERYDVSGFFFNMMSFNERDYSRRYRGVCHCESCLCAFRDHSPTIEHPTDPSAPGYGAWQSFTGEVLDELTARMRAHLKQLRPDAGLVLGNQSDITFHEANNAVGRPLWHHATAEAVSAARAVDPGRPVLVNSVGFVDMPYRWAGEDPHHFSQYLLQTISRGAQPSTYVMGTPDNSQYEALEAGAQLTRFHRDHEGLYAELRSDSRVALVRPTSPPADAVSEFRGCYLSLVESHVPFEVLPQADLANARLSRFELLILPDVGSLRSQEVAATDSFLSSGGAVALTGDSAWHDGRLQLADGELTASLRGRYTTEESVRSLHLPLGNRDHVPVVGGFAILDPGDDPETDWHAVGRAPYGPPEKCHGHQPTSHPGWISFRVGSGRLGLMPWRPGLVYGEVGLQRVRDAWVGKVLSLTDCLPVLTTDLPAQAEIVIGRTQGSTIIHLLNRSGDAPQRFIRPVPIGAHTLRLQASTSPVSVHAHVSNKELDWTFQEGEVSLTTPTFDVFEVIEMRWS